MNLRVGVIVVLDVGGGGVTKSNKLCFVESNIHTKYDQSLDETFSAVATNHQNKSYTCFCKPQIK